MIFTVTYRGADGAVREERVEAAGRGECFAQCRARDITPITVKEGWSGRGKTPTVRASRTGDVSSLGDGARPKVADGGQGVKSPSVVGKALPAVGLALAIIIGVGVWWLGREKTWPSPDHEVPKKTSLTKRVKPAVAPKAKTEALVANERLEGASLGNNEQPDRPFRRGSIDEITNLTCEAVTPEQKLYRKRLAALSNRVFKTASDQILAMAVGAEGAPMPPLPIGGDKMDEDFRRSLEVPIEILDSDPPSIRQLKAAVLEARLEMSRMLAKGYTVQEVLKEHMQLANENREIRLNAERELRSIAESGDEESARRYANSVNAALQQMGISPIDYRKSSAAQRRAEAMERRRAVKNAENGKGDQR